MVIGMKPEDLYHPTQVGRYVSGLSCRVAPAKLAGVNYSERPASIILSGAVELVH